MFVTQMHNEYAPLPRVALNALLNDHVVVGPSRTYMTDLAVGPLPERPGKLGLG
jgi:hypothetical protein